VAVLKATQSMLKGIFFIDLDRKGERIPHSEVLGHFFWCSGRTPESQMIGTEVYTVAGGLDLGRELWGGDEAQFLIQNIQSIWRGLWCVE